jgi:hypothetical protein
LFILLDLATPELARLDRDKANDIPWMDGGVFGSAWHKLQLRQAALAVGLLMSCGPSLLSLSLFCYVFPIHTPQKYLFGNSRLHFSDTSIVFETTGKEFKETKSFFTHRKMSLLVESMGHSPSKLSARRRVALTLTGAEDARQRHRPRA